MREWLRQLLRLKELEAILLTAKENAWGLCHLEVRGTPSPLRGEGEGPLLGLPPASVSRPDR